MSKRESFIQEIEELIEWVETSKEKEITKETKEYLEEMKNTPVRKSVPITENGKDIIEFMRKEEENSANKFLSREIAEGLFTSSRSVSGAMRKLFTDGFVDKSTDSPIIYSLTEKGRTFEL